MTQAGLLPRGSHREEREALAEAGRLLGRGRYNQAADIVLGLEQQYERAGETVAAEMLGLAHELCLACRDHHSEAEVHQRAVAVAAGLEHRVRERLTTILARATSGARGGARTRVAPARPRSRHAQRAGPLLAAHCLGPLRVDQEGSILVDWPNRRAKAVFRYLVIHRTGPKEVLMDLFWPEANPRAARNNLNVAVYALRQFLGAGKGNFSYVLFRDDCYLLNPELELWVDVEEFGKLVDEARRLDGVGDPARAVEQLQTAEALYQGDLFEDDPYEEWILPRRRELQDTYLRLLDRLREHYVACGDAAACTTTCRKMLTVDRCREDAHAELMRCYAGQGQHYLALRQFNDCEEALRRELDVDPSDALRELSDRIRRREPIPGT